MSCDLTSSRFLRGIICPLVAVLLSYLSVSAQTTDEPKKPVELNQVPETPVIAQLSPKLVYPVDRYYQLHLFGSGFDPAKSRLSINGMVVDFSSFARSEENKNLDKTVFFYRTDTNNGVKPDEFELWLSSSTYGGRTKIAITSNGQASAPVEALLANIASANQVRWLAALLTAGILAIPLYIAYAKLGGHAVGSKQYSGLAALFIDPETDTYSLSKFQFYVWTAAAIFGYIYLALSQSLVQGIAVFPEIPDNLPGIIFISAATTVIATGATAAKGPKGAGDIHPSSADFISAGGVVAPERFQFFVWTLLGVIGFIFFVVTSDPGTIKSLPAVPSSFLQLMGISSLGYLGGKLAREPGPVIDQIVPTFVAAAGAVPATLTLVITGQKLSDTPGFKIDGEDVTLAPPSATGTDPTAVFTPGKKDDKPGMIKDGTLVVTNPRKGSGGSPDWVKAGEHTLTVVNQDGKLATWTYKLP